MATTVIPETHQQAAAEWNAKPGRFGAYGGRYVPETLIRALDQLSSEYERALADPAFQSQLDDLFSTFGCWRRMSSSPMYTTHCSPK